MRLTSVQAEATEKQTQMQKLQRHLSEATEKLHSWEAHAGRLSAVLDERDEQLVKAKG